MISEGFPLGEHFMISGKGFKEEGKAVPHATPPQGTKE